MSGKNSKGKNYPWDLWLKKGTSRKLKYNKHYFCTDRSMTTYLYSMAKAKGVKVVVKAPKPGVLSITVHNGNLDGRSKS